MSNYHLIKITPEKYKRMETFSAESLEAAIEYHINPKHHRNYRIALFMRTPTGKRYTLQDSLDIRASRRLAHE